MNAADFVAKWNAVELTERSAAQQHFCDLCELLGHPKPADVDHTGDTFTFEKGAAKHSGGDGWADVWKKDFFGWEYKGKHKDLDTAYNQLLDYRADLENPPLLVVCDMDRILVHTNFNNTPTRTFEVTLQTLDQPRNLEILRAVFNEPDKLRPGVTSHAITETASGKFAEIAQSMHARGLDPQTVAHFLVRVVFCLFAEDVGLLPTGLFTNIVAKAGKDPKKLARYISDLFAAMADGGDFLLENIRHFNGSLFDKSPILELTADEIDRIAKASDLDWSAVDVSISGTLFERGLDPAKRSQIGAHYTSRNDIETLIDPVVLAPLRREWAEVRAAVVGRLPSGGAAAPAASGDAAYKKSVRKHMAEAEQLITGFLERLRRVRVLDPAGGAANFLYVTLQKLLDLEKEVNHFLRECGFTPEFPRVSPQQLFCIEINPYAHDLAQTTVWIGYIQWLRANGYGFPAEPILRPMQDNFQCADALFTDWPTVDFIVSNPPFLGDKMMRGQLDDEYVDKLRKFYEGRVPGGADLCCYWFEKARAHVEARKVRRAGLLATQNIRGGASREVLKRIKNTGSIFFAVSDRDWILDGANVHVSMIAFDDGDEKTKTLDGKVVTTINANLSATADTTQAKRLPANAAVGFIGSCKGGPFDIDEVEAMQLLHEGGNPHGCPNSDVIRPVVNSDDLMMRRKQRWIIDNADREVANACLYEAPHKIVLERVKPVRDTNRDRWLRENWWRPQRMRQEMRNAINPLARFLVTPTTSKHRIFSWLSYPTLPDHKLVVFANDTDYFFGVLHARVHEVWARAQGTQLRERESGLNYNVQSSFETFPFPEPTAEQRAAIAAAAKELDTLRNQWLNPPEWTREEVLEFPASAGGPWGRYVVGPLPSAGASAVGGAGVSPAVVKQQKAGETPAPPNQVGTARYPRLVPKDADCAKQLAKRTLTNLYNERPTWLANAHAKLDAAVFAAYGWPANLTDEQILERLLKLNLEHAAKA